MEDNSEIFGLLSKPHTISGMIVGGVLLVYFAFTRDVTVATPSNVKSGLFAGCLVFLLFSMLQMRDGLFRRPHPAFWRVVMGFAVLYLFALVFLLFQDTINDEFIWAHLIGWWCKTVLLRDASLCWLISVLFEIWEITFEHMLPNFKECWWDHIILDIIVCNGLGIYIGMLTCRALHMKEYDWAGMWNIPNKKGKIWYKVLQQFTPFSYDEYNWELLKDSKRFTSVCIIIGMVSFVCAIVRDPL